MRKRVSANEQYVGDRGAVELFCSTMIENAVNRVLNFLRDGYRSSLEDAQHAWAWLTGECEGLFSFRDCCDGIGAEPDYLIDRLRREFNSEHPEATELLAA